MLRLTLTVAVATMLVASAALAGGAHCTAQQTASNSAACAGKSQMTNVKVEATRLASGDLIVHYAGLTPEAISYLHAKTEGTASKFCCPMTQKMASNESCKVDVNKVSNGVIVYVTSPKKEAIDTYEKEFAALHTTSTTATK
jgi:hypothetical protein